MLINKIEVDEGRDIVIIDEAFKFGDHLALYDTCMSLKYSCKNTSNLDIQNISDKRMRADLPQLDQMQLMAMDEEGARLRKSLCPDCFLVRPALVVYFFEPSMNLNPQSFVPIK